MSCKNAICFCSLLFICVSAFSSIPASIRTYIDYTGTLRAEDITDYLLKKAEPDIYAGTVTGVLWVTVRFPANENPVVMHFGNEFADTIELYIRGDTGWQTAGLTGRAVPRQKRNIPSHKSAVIIPAAAGKTHFREVLLRIANTDAIALSIQIENGIPFFTSAMTAEIPQTIFMSAAWTITVLLIVASVILKNSVLLSGAGMAAALLLYQTATQSPGGFRYICAAAAAYFATSIMTKRITQINGFTYQNKLLCIYITIETILLSIVLVYRSSTNFYTGLLIAGIFSSVIVIIYSIIHSKPYRYLTVITACWTPALLFASVRQLFYTLRYKSSAGILRIFDNDTHISHNIIFIFMIAPFIYDIIVRCLNIKREITDMQMSADNLQEQLQNKELMGNCVRRELMNSLIVIKNSATDTEAADTAFLQNTILKSSECAIQLISICSILDKKIIENKTLHPTIPVKVNEILRNSLRQTENLASSRSNTVQVHCTPPESLVFLGTPAVIDYIFTRLLENALKYSDRGTALTIYLDYQDTILSYDIHNVSVPVTGEEADKLFQISQPESCWNVSLYLLRQLCLFSGGSACIVPGRHGNIFSARLKLQECAQTNVPIQEKDRIGSDTFSAKNGSPEQHKTQDAQNLLIIHDNTVMSGYIYSLFKDTYNIRQAAAGNDALELLKQYTPDLIICEYMLPVISGYELFKKCCKSPQLSAVPFIMIGTELSEEDKTRFLSEGITACIDTSFQPAAFKAQVSAFMEMGRKIRNKIFADIITAVSKTMGQPAGIQLPLAPSQDILDTSNLSDREKEIATLISYGKSDKEIAAELNISLGTVASHNKNIFKKLDVHSRVELISKLR